ncbi:MAG: ABC-type Mn2+/Zn2+ transport system permease subunit [Glaciecola sp.]|jgi:ABC-type Mn2+/Zn2+ transport system permease subunit
MDALIEPFTSNPELRNALAAGLLTVIATSVVGTWVVLRGMSFIGDAIAHGVIPGIALAVLWGFNPLVGAAVAVVVMVGGIGAVGRRSRLSSDTSIGLLFVGMLALGVVIASINGSEAEALTDILFGDALGVTGGDILAIGVTALVVLAVTVVAYRPLLVLSFSEPKAAALGFRPALAHGAMLLLVGLTIVVSFTTVGTLMVFAFLVAPPAAASLVVRRVPAMMAVGVGFGMLAVYVGLLGSHHLVTPPSASIAVVAVAQFFVVLVAKELVTARGARLARTAVVAP